MKKWLLLIAVLFCFGIKGVPAPNNVLHTSNSGYGRETHTATDCKFDVRMTVRRNVSCAGSNNGVVSAVPLGGASPYAYSWSPGGATGNIVTGLSAGSYTVYITDINGCTGIDSVTVRGPTTLSLTVHINPAASCSGDSIASATAMGSGGTSPYTYSWSGGRGTRATATGLSPGTYTVTLHDSCGTVVTRSVIITRPVALSSSITIINNVSCHGGADGAAKAAVSGGTSPFTYSWTPNSSTTYLANGLSAGTYTVTVTDYNGCTGTARVTITQPTTFITERLSSVTYPVCHGGDGSATISASGGFPPYTYIWTPNVSTTSTGTGLTARSYVVEVKDSRGCTSTLSVTITQPAGMSLHVYTVPAHRTCVGSAWVTVSGGISPYNYVWTGGQTTDTIVNQCAGTYCCTITEGNGCTDSVCATIPVATGVEEVSSNSDGVTVYPNPGNGVFTVQLSNNEQGILNIEVFNVLGQEVYSQFAIYNSRPNDSSGRAPFTIDLRNQSAGIYLYRIIGEGENLIGSGKLIIQK